MGIGIPLGVLAAVRRNGVSDYLLSVGSLVGISVPSFFLAMGLVYVFSLQLRILPISGMSTPGESNDPLDVAAHLALPAAVLGISLAALFLRFTRASVLETLRQDYLVAARAKGMSESQVIIRHALPNALIPIIAVVGVVLPFVVSGAAIIERVFSWPGIGQLTLNAAERRDYPVIIAGTMLVAVAVVISNLATDLAYTIADPRTRPRAR